MSLSDISRMEQKVTKEIRKVAEKRREYPKQIRQLLEAKFKAEFNILSLVKYPELTENVDFTAADQQTISTIKDTLDMLTNNGALLSSTQHEQHALIKNSTAESTPAVLPVKLLDYAGQLSYIDVQIPKLSTISSDISEKCDTVTDDDDIVGGSDRSLVTSQNHANKQRTSTPLVQPPVPGTKVQHRRSQLASKADDQYSTTPSKHKLSKQKEQNTITAKQKATDCTPAKLGSKSSKPKKKTPADGTTQEQSEQVTGKSPSRIPTPTRTSTRTPKQTSTRTPTQTSTRTPTTRTSRNNRQAGVISDEQAFRPSNKVMHTPDVI